MKNNKIVVKLTQEEYDEYQLCIDHCIRQTAEANYKNGRADERKALMNRLFDLERFGNILNN